ncbi:MAG: hypothetical protein IJZ35_09905 [Clostridia bacterium]|nr:hypothetical protein [Clostridia bacterium]
MRNFKKILSVLLVAVLALASISIVAAAENAEIGESDTLNVISYDLQSIRTSLGEAIFSLGDVAELGSILNAMKYDIVAVQEDFDVKWEDYPVGVEVPDYHDTFVDQMKNYADIYEEESEDIIGGVVDSILGNEAEPIERHQTISGGDGLGIYSTYSIYDTERQKWDVAENSLDDGSYRLYQTGFVVTTVELAEGYYLDIYNVSADEYTDADSVAARQAQFAQLAEFIKKHSVYDEELGVYEHAVIVLGNFYAGICEEDTTYANNGVIANLLENAGLNDAWAVTTINGIAENPESYDVYYNYALRTELTVEQSFGHYDSAEKILYASGNGIALTCDSFNYVDIQGASGVSLSDHKASVAQITYEIVEKTYEYGNEGADKNVDTEESWLIRFLNSIANIFKAIGYFFQNLFS